MGPELLLALLACGGPPPLPPSRVEGRTWYAPGTGVAVDFPQGWTVVIEPELFRADLPETLLEGRRDETLLAISWHGLAALRLFPQASALDLMAWRVPVGEPEGEGWSTQRLPDCHEAIEQVLIGDDGRPLARVGLRGEGGLLLFQAWRPDGAPDLAPVRALICAHTRVTE